VRRARDAAAGVRLDPEAIAGMAGPIIAERVRAARIEAIRVARAA
jgi:hypothetical protein